MKSGGLVTRQGERRADSCDKNDDVVERGCKRRKCKGRTVVVEVGGQRAVAGATADERRRRRGRKPVLRRETKCEKGDTKQPDHQPKLGDLCLYVLPQVMNRMVEILCDQGTDGVLRAAETVAAVSMTCKELRDVIARDRVWNSFRPWVQELDVAQSIHIQRRDPCKVQLVRLLRRLGHSPNRSASKKALLEKLEELRWTVSPGVCTAPDAVRDVLGWELSKQNQSEEDKLFFLTNAFAPGEAHVYGTRRNYLWEQERIASLARVDDAERTTLQARFMRAVRTHWKGDNKPAQFEDLMELVSGEGADDVQLLWMFRSVMAGKATFPLKTVVFKIEEALIRRKASEARERELLRRLAGVEGFRKTSGEVPSTLNEAMGLIRLFGGWNSDDIQIQVLCFLDGAHSIDCVLDRLREMMVRYRELEERRKVFVRTVERALSSSKDSSSREAHKDLLSVVEDYPIDTFDGIALSLEEFVRARDNISATEVADFLFSVLQPRFVLTSSDRF